VNLSFAEAPMHVLMLDDHVMFLQGLKNLLSVLAPQLRVETADNLAHALQLVQLSNFDLVLLDWHLAENGGETSLRGLRDSGCMARVVVLSGETSGTLIRHTIELGAAGFIPKKFSSEMMLTALSQVLAGRIFLPAEALAQEGGAVDAKVRGIDGDPRFVALTPRQIEVYLAAARGLPNKLIARQLDIAESTVKTHLTAVYAALGVSNRTEAAYQASRDGLRIA
jgi:DNA-binding NarL/FixJ family response regulator